MWLLDKLLPIVVHTWVRSDLFKLPITYELPNWLDACIEKKTLLAHILFRCAIYCGRAL
jgi:hypothetical protein